MGKKVDMRRRYYVIFLLLIPIILFGVVLLKEAHVPPEVLKEVENYLVLKTGSRIAHPSIFQKSRAQRPWNFRAEMSARSFGDSVYYLTDESYGAKHSGLTPLFYPPNDIWCVFFQESDQVPQIVYVAAHVDLYNADWILHEPANENLGGIETIGCEVKGTP